MLTSVVKTILDDSISGDKIDGGTISGLDLIMTDAIYCPATPPGSANLSYIDGVNFKIGFYYPIGLLMSESIILKKDTGSILGLDSLSIPHFYLGMTNKYSYLRLNNNSVITRFLLHTSSDSFLYPSAGLKLIIGGDTSSHTRSIQFPAGFWANDPQINYLTLTDGLIYNATLRDASSGLTYTLDRVLSSFATMESNFLATPGDASLDEPWDTLKDITYAATSIAQMDSIAGVIQGQQWLYVDYMDQFVQKSANVEFESVKAKNAEGVKALITTPYNFKSGLTLSCDLTGGNPTDLYITKGACVDSENEFVGIFNPTGEPLLTGDVSAAWGTLNGVRSSAGGPSSWFNVYIIIPKDPSLYGEVTWGLDSDADITAWTLRFDIASIRGGTRDDYAYRRIGCVYLDGSNQVRLFYQIENKFFHIEPIRARGGNETDFSISWADLSLVGAPTAIPAHLPVVEAMLFVETSAEGVSIGRLFFHHKAPSMPTITSDAAQTLYMTGSAGVFHHTPVTVLANYGVIKAKKTNTGTTFLYDINSIGWVDKFNDNEW